MSTTAAMPASINHASSKSNNAEKLGEAEFLQQEADRAKAAITESITAIRKSLGSAADPHRLTKDHPWIAMGAAAVAGFAAAATLVPSKEQQALRALAALERSAHGSETKEADKKAAGSASGPASGLLGLIFAELFKLLRPLLTALVTSAVASKDDDSTSANDVDNTNAEPTSGDAPGIATPS